MIFKTTICKASKADIITASSAAIKTAAHPQEKMSKYHGEIARQSDGTTDIVAEMAKRPDALWIRVKAIEADRENDNGDYFSRDEIIKAYKSFEGCPVFTNHENSKVENAKGKVIHADWDDKEGAVYCTMFVDRKVAPGLCRAIEEGYITDVSMGTQVDFSTCSVCGNKAITADNYCFVPGTPILMADFSVKSIEDIKEGDEVIDAFGLPSKVTKTFSRDVDEKIQALSSRLINGSLLCTGNHPILVNRRGEYRFVHAHDLDDKDVLFCPVYGGDVSEEAFSEIEFEKTSENKAMFSRLMGYYAAKGCVAEQCGDLYSTEFSLHSYETSTINDIKMIALALFGKEASIFQYPERSAGCSVRIYDHNLAIFFSKYIPGIKKNKRLTAAVTHLPLEYVKAFLAGYVDGDGCTKYESQCIINTDSQNLNSQVLHMMLRVGAAPSVYSYMQPGGPTSRDKRFSAYRLTIAGGQLRPIAGCGSKLAKFASMQPKRQEKTKNVFTPDGFAKHTAYGISEQAYTGKVYNFETESHSYIANNTAVHNCDHVKTMKGRSIGGSKVFEKNYGLKFIEISVVTIGACKDCTIREVLDASEMSASLSKAAQNIRDIVKTGRKDDESIASIERVAWNLGKVAQDIKEIIRTGVLSKEGGQDEIRKLNQSMDLLEDVARSMLAQRQYVDMEFLSDLTEVLADLQHVTDELVDQGYASVGAAAQEPGLPSPPGQASGMTPEIPTMQEQEQGAPNASITGPADTGVGKITEPATAAADPKRLLVAKIKDLHDQARKFLEEDRSSRGGIETVNIADKHQETVKKLAGIWENPSVKDYKTEISEGDFKIVVGRDEVIGLLGTEKVASLMVADLDLDIRASLESKPRDTAGHMLDALKAKFAGMRKEAEGAPTNAKEQHGQTMEVQIEEQRPPLHPREHEVRESITEKQLQENWREYEYHDRKDEPRDSITEKQLEAGKYRMPDHFKRQKDPRDEVMEGQLRDKGIKGNETPADKGGAWVAGVDDQNQQITEGQLEDWKKSDSSHHPTMITEKQLGEQREPWGRRIASKDDARMALAAGMKAIVRTAMATKATPAEIISSAREFYSTPEKELRATGFANSAASKKEDRSATLRRARFHGQLKVASKDDVQNFLLGSLSDAGMTGEVGLKVIETLINQNGAAENFADAIKAGLEDEAEPVVATEDFLKEAAAESEEEIVKVLIPASEVKAKNDEEFADAAFAVASKLALAQELTPTKLVHVAKKEKVVEVSMRASKNVLPEQKVAKADCGCSASTSKGCSYGGKYKCHEKNADSSLKERKEARRKIVEAQMPGGGMPAGPNPMGAPGGTTMPTPPPGDPMAGAGAPVSALGEEPMADEDATAGTDGEDGEALPPISFCPMCKSDDVDVKGGDWNCNACGADGDVTINMRIKSAPGVIEEKGPASAGGNKEGIEMPEIGLAASFRITPEMVKKAGNKPLGSVCPHCSSSKVRLAMSDGSGRGKCEKCDGNYRVDTFVNTQTNDLWGRIEWIDQNVIRLAASRTAAKTSIKKAKLERALKSKGLSAKFAKANLGGKAEIIASLHNKGVID